MFGLSVPAVEPYVQWVFFGNEGMAWLEAVVVFLGLWLAFWLLKKIVLVRLQALAKRTVTTIDDVVVAAVRKVSWPVYAIVALFVASRPLVLPSWLDAGMGYVLFAVVLFAVVRVVSVIIDWFADREAGKREEEGNSAIYVLGKIGKFALWIVAVLLLLQNIGVEITPLIAAMGVGGIAIAFALQNILEDLFSSFSIYFDKPFIKGDFIIVGDDLGVVKYIGMKTTRIQTLQGQELIISNRELTSTRVNNYKRMEERRVQFGFGVEYGTTLANCKRINDLVKRVIDKAEHARLDRTHFREFGDSALLYEVVYYVDSPDYNRYMDVQQAINFGIKEAFDAAGISMAFPTRTVHLVR